MDITNALIKSAVRRFPELVPHLKGRARWIAYSIGGMDAGRRLEFKTVEFYLRQLQGLIRAVYNGILGGEFIDIMANLIQGQLTQAFQLAIDEAGAEWNDELRAAVEEMILSEYTHVDQLYRDIVDARVDGTPIDPLLQRAQLWANRWNDAYNHAKQLIASMFGERMIWVYGDTDHCDTCLSLNGIVAFASEWEQLNVRPQNPPNPLLICGGWRCQCRLEVTTQRRSPKAFQTIMNIVSM